MEYKVSQAVCTGRRHRLEDTPCQDRVAVRRTEELVCCTLADGAGSRSHSELGAECVTRAAAELLTGEFEALWAMEQPPLAEAVISRCVQALNSLEPPIYELACTLLFCVCHRDGRFLAGHLGDGVMIHEAEGELSVFSPPENGAFQNETYFITGADAVGHLRLRRGRWMCEGALLMMSDGTADSLYRYADGTPASACRTLAGWLREGEEEVVSQALQDNLERTFAGRTSDDMSLILLSWQEEGGGPGETPPEEGEAPDPEEEEPLPSGGGARPEEVPPQQAQDQPENWGPPAQEDTSGGACCPLTERGDIEHGSELD